LIRILTQLLQRPLFRRFPSLKDRFQSTVVAFLKQALIPTNKLVHDLVSMEANYINTGHPDFLNGHRAMAVIQERLNAKNNPGNTPANIASHDNKSRLGFSNPLSGSGSGSAGVNAAVPPGSNSAGNSPALNAFLDGSGEQANSTASFFGSFFASGTKKKKGSVMEAVSR
jgi:dynamin 1-like protein